MEEIERDMAFEGKKVAEAVKEIISQGPSAVGHIMEQEVHPFIEDVQTLATSMANLYQEHAAHFLALGVKVNIEVSVLDKPALKSQVGANPFDDNDTNRVVHENAASSVQ